MTRRGRVNFESCDNTDSPSATGRNGRVSPTPTAISELPAKPEPPQARQPLTQCNQAPTVPTENGTASRYEELMAEAEALLDKVKAVQPVGANEHKQRNTALASKQQRAAFRNKLAIVRVRVSSLSSYAPAFSVLLATEKQMPHCANTPCKTLLLTAASLFPPQVAGKTIGVPAALAQRIAVYSDNATKQLQLDRQCRAYEKQRHLRTTMPAQHIDHVLLNKAAIILPAKPLTGTLHA